MDRINVNQYDYRFLVESTVLSPSQCPKCGTVTNLYKYVIAHTHGIHLLFIIYIRKRDEI